MSMATGARARGAGASGALIKLLLAFGWYGDEINRPTSIWLKPGPQIATMGKISIGDVGISLRIQRRMNLARSDVSQAPADPTWGLLRLRHTHHGAVVVTGESDRFVEGDRRNQTIDAPRKT